jgi:hypothetical protein
LRGKSFFIRRPKDGATAGKRRSPQKASKYIFKVT